MLSFNGMSLPLGQDVTIGDFVHSYDSLLIMDEADRVALGVMTVGPEPLTLEQVKAARLEQLAIRRKVATQTFSFNGMQMLLDKDTEDAIAKCKQGLEDLLSIQEAPSIDFEISRGVFITMDLPTITAIGRAAFLHVQACFSRVKALTADILAATDEGAVLALDIDAGWPQ